MRLDAIKRNDPERMQMWAGQSARLAQAKPAGALLEALWEEALTFLR